MMSFQGELAGRMAEAHIRGVEPAFDPAFERKCEIFFMTISRLKELIERAEPGLGDLGAAERVHARLGSIDGARQDHAIAFAAGYFEFLDEFPDGRLEPLKWDRIRALKKHAEASMELLREVFDTDGDVLSVQLLAYMALDVDPNPSAGGDYWDATSRAREKLIDGLNRVSTACGALLMESSRLPEKGLMLVDIVIGRWREFVGDSPTARDLFVAVEEAQKLGVRLDPYVESLTEKSLASILEHLHKVERLSSRYADRGPA